MTNDFDAIYQLMENSFPKNEIRTYEEMKKQITDDRFRFITKYKNDTLIALLGLWGLENCQFVEYLAISENEQGSGLGSSMMTELLQRTSKVILLEVEPPVDTQSRKRVVFYERLGFHLNTRYYSIPPLREGETDLELKLMSYPKMLTDYEFEDYKNELFQELYLADVQRDKKP